MVDKLVVTYRSRVNRTVSWLRTQVLHSWMRAIDWNRKEHREIGCGA
ncbi:MAG: hypothetical protein AAGA75_19610 [Cyanobacteria bacterium P01_E01_bin.6]